MTTPAERTEAVKMAATIAREIAPMLDESNPVRAYLRFMERHLPTLGELELTHEKCPELWGKP
jgi:hypothetical protein